VVLRTVRFSARLIGHPPDAVAPDPVTPVADNDDIAHPEYQLDLRPMTDADGWVRYVLKQGPAARRLIVKGKSPDHFKGTTA
jgi:hypothetical protein